MGRSAQGPEPFGLPELLEPTDNERKGGRGMRVTAMIRTARRAGRRSNARRAPRSLLLLLLTAVVLVTGTSCQAPRNGVAAARRIAWMQLNARGWIPQAQCLVDLWQAESGWNVYALNKSSGAYGIPQALPANRMGWAGRDWVRNPATQIRWGLNYIQMRYGGPCNAWRHWRAVHWYQRAGTDAATTASDGSAGS